MASLVLASASPQRKTLLSGLGVTFDVCPSAVDESACTEQNPRTRSLILAQLKARDVGRKFRDAWIIGCDTLVVSQDDTLLEKPADARDALRMLDLHSGGTCVVHSGLALLSPDGREESAVSSSSVIFKTLTPEEKKWWIASELWRDRSGGFQIDGRGQLMIERIEGDWTSIVGFPVFLFGQLCSKMSVQF